MSISVIISALNEPHLYKTVMSIVENSYDSDLDEIIIIDDCSDEPIVIDCPKVKIVRNNIRQGLIRSRDTAARMASGDYIISIDAHCKVYKNWVQPLVDILNDNYRNVAIPATVGLNPDTWTENRSKSFKSGLRWDLDFYWYDDYINDSYSPIFAGHCFAFTKQWFLESGGFDIHMDRWGCENIEFSLRTWLCGGSVLVAKNSLVAHYFKSKWTYEMDGKTLLANKIRVVEVWFENYADRFYSAIKWQRNNDMTKAQLLTLNERLEYKKKLQVRPFQWFLDHLQPDLKIYDLKGKPKSKNIAILGSGPSLDYLNKDCLKQFDCVIGINYNALVFDCHYVMFHDIKPYQTIVDSQKYIGSQLLVPIGLKDAKKFTPSKKVAPTALMYRLGEQDSSKPLEKNNFTFFHHASTVHTAVHMATFMGAKTVTLFGCDTKFAPDGRSHTSIVEQYRKGFYWPDNNESANYFARIGRGYELLKKYCLSNQVALLRHDFL